MEEALGLMAAAEQGDRSQLARMRILVSVVRGDQNILEYDRYVLVARLRALDLPSSEVGRAKKFAAYAEEARKLIGEFPNQTDPFVSLLALAEDSSDTPAAGQLALELVESNAPLAVKVGAGRLLDREAMVGTSIDFSLTDFEGRIISLAKLKGKSVVVYVWTAQGPGAADWVRRLVDEADDKTVAIGINFDRDVAAARAEIARVAPDSIQIYEPLGMEAAAVAVLKLARCPSVYLIDRNGVLRDVHGLERFSEKIALMRESLHP
ncbi:MAG: hypothetical protein JWM32_2703 [Verrucomicrobia bacterium]|nr:hypothetical protein [Verrucomicrobiota bacterium]